jgi:hypothetical protein
MCSWVCKLQETKQAKNDDVFPDGMVIKGGNFVSFSPYAMGRLECLWGADVFEFKPERWLKGGIFQPPSPFKLTAFQVRFYPMTLNPKPINRVHEVLNKVILIC